MRKNEDKYLYETKEMIWMHTKWNTKFEKNTVYFVQWDLKSHSDYDEDSVQSHPRRTAYSVQVRLYYKLFNL
jgi:hypothetical protein